MSTPVNWKDLFQTAHGFRPMFEPYEIPGIPWCSECCDFHYATEDHSN